METKDKKYFISIYISFIAVIVTIVSVLYSTYMFKTNFELLSIFIAVFASFIGAVLFVFYKRITTRKFKSKIFISYANNDRDYADKIRRTLMNERFVLNIDEKNIQVGENIKNVISNEIKSSSIFIVLLSQNSIKSDFVNNEIKYAIENGKKILPVLIEKDVDIPTELMDIQFADFSENEKDAMSKLISALKNNLNE